MLGVMIGKMVHEHLAWMVLARNEIRVCTRLSRTKFILAVALVLCTWYFVILTMFHMLDSGVVPMHGVLSPRYLMSILGDSYLALFCLGVLLLSYDIHSRDENNRIQEILQSKPVDNLQFFAGRLFGIFVVMGLPMVFFLLVAVFYGVLSGIFALPFGEPIEPWSVVSFLILDVVPTFFFFGSLVFFLGWLIKPRFVALFVSAFCLYGLMWVNSRLPLEIFKPLQTVTGNVIFPSEIIPNFLEIQVVLNRLALILLGIGFLYWLSVLYARNTGSNVAQRAKGFYAFGGGILFILGMVGSNYLEQQQVAGWKRFHDQHFEPSSFPDIHRLSGSVDLYPGRNIVLDLNLDVSVSEEYRGDYVLFSLNPNYRIKQITVAGEKVKGRRFNKGLLKIPRQYFEGSKVEMQLQATGRPKSKFAYLDSIDKISNIFGPEAHQLRYLGTKNYIFDPRFVALMPGIKWYPTSGTATREDSWSTRQKDFFAVDLQVSVPSKWLVAGPAKRELVENKGRSVFRFQTQNPVPRIALVASRFERASQQVGAVEFELLYDRSHRRNFEPFTVADNPAQRLWVEDLLEEVSSAGLEYPYSAYSLVEVPAALRTFGSDSELSSVLGMPGILMMPETSLPTMHFDSLYDFDDGYSSTATSWNDPRWVRATRHSLYEYFGFDQYIGNHLVHFYQSVLSDQINATGPDALMLNLVLEQLVQLVLANREISFDFDSALDRNVLDLTQIDAVQIINLFRILECQKDTKCIYYDRSEQHLDLLSARDRQLNSDLVLDVVETMSLFDFESSKISTVEQRALRIRSLAVSKVLVDVWGTDVVSSILVELLQRFRGQNLTYDDFVSVAQSRGIDFESRLDDMIHSTGLPGFIASDAAQHRVQTENSEQSTFQTTFTLQNGEPVSGYCFVTPINHLSDRVYSDLIEKSPIFVDRNQAFEVVIQSELPLHYIEIKPYLSLNRTKFQIFVPKVQDLSDEEQERVEFGGGTMEIISVREIENAQADDTRFIVIDDLDAGFSVVDKSNRFKVHPIAHFARSFIGVSDRDVIRGLPAFQFEEIAVPKDTWERKTEPTAYGKYWKTYTLNQKGGGETYARFASKLPTPGLWRLEYFLPDRYVIQARQYAKNFSSVISRISRGVAQIDVHIDGVARTELLDPEDLELGWYVIGNYNIEDPEVEVWISNPNDWGVVFADAIRWSPVEDSD
ncbi:MAG: M1 family metallopeptidase [Gammaproteobacteria bacterium]|nr:M1 family metallopeptidase [Gammaproteobacteria bacterium]MYF38711.1 M1 family metallopeptidase [Gammaproteobacteria bacterium]